MLRMGLLLLALISGAARAEWREATSKHFIVYSEGKEEDLRKAVMKLERYDRLLRWASRVNKPDAPVKLKIYLMQSPGALRKSMGVNASGVLGYYTASSRGPIAVGLRYDPAGDGGMSADQVLFHEYAHHITFQYFPAAYPTWFTEGFAEFYGRTRIGEDDVVEVGHAALGRYRSFDNWLPLNRMLTAQSYSDIGDGIFQLYAQGWLLVHYLVNSEQRKGQLAVYLDAVNAGETYEAAMNKAFGPGARALDSELRSYSARRSIPAMRIPFKPLDIGQVPVRTLSPSEQALLEREIDLGRGLLVKEAKAFAREVRAAAQRFPDDPYALSILVEAERAAGDNLAAMAAVDRWLAVKPGAPRALMHKAQLQIAGLKASSSKDGGAWQAAQALLATAHKASPLDPLILEAYYDSFRDQGVVPPAGAQNALYRAFELVPQDAELRYKLAADFEQRNMIDEAITVIKPVAVELHPDADASAREKKEREKLEDEYRQVGQEKHETAWEMFVRLEKRKSGGGAKAAGTR